LRKTLEQVLAGVPAGAGDDLRDRVLKDYSWDAATDRLEEVYLRVTDERLRRAR
jgi:hypothetical protein